MKNQCIKYLLIIYSFIANLIKCTANSNWFEWGELGRERDR